MFTHVQCCDIVPSLVSSFGESLDTGLYFALQLPCSFDHFCGAGRSGEPPPPRGAGRPSLPNSTSQPIAELLFSTSYILLLNYKQISNHLKSARINFSSSTLCRHTGGRLTGRRLLIDGLRLQVDLHFCTFALLHFCTVDTLTLIHSPSGAEHTHAREYTLRHWSLCKHISHCVSTSTGSKC